MLIPAAVLLSSIAASPAASAPEGLHTEIRRALERLKADQEIPGVSVVIARDDRVWVRASQGAADLAPVRAMTADQRVYAGSLSKIFTAVLAVHLEEKGKLSLADPLSKHLPELTDAAAGTVTLEQLVTHAGGIPREGNFDYWFSADFPDEKRLLKYAKTVELEFKPGTDLVYSNVGYALLGLALGRAAGSSYPEALEKRILKPLGLARSGAPGPAAEMASGYSPVGTVLPTRLYPFAGLGAAVGERRVRMYHDAKAMSPAFGVFTTPEELGRLGRFLLGHGGDDVVSVRGRERMRTRQKSGWGLGLKVQRKDGARLVRHDGWFAAHRSHLLLDPKRGLSVAVMTNADSASPSLIALELWRTARSHAP